MLQQVGHIMATEALVAVMVLPPAGQCRPGSGRYCIEGRINGVAAHARCSGDNIVVGGEAASPTKVPSTANKVAAGMVIHNAASFTGGISGTHHARRLSSGRVSRIRHAPVQGTPELPRFTGLLRLAMSRRRNRATRTTRSGSRHYAAASMLRRTNGGSQRAWSARQQRRITGTPAMLKLASETVRQEFSRTSVV